MADRKYTDAEVAAVGHAYEELGIRPWAEVVRRAKAGELVGHDGEPVAAFELNVNSARDLGRRWRERGGWQRPDGPLELAPPRDAIEAHRRDLISLAEEELAFEKAKPKGERDPLKLKRIAQTIVEAARIPGPRDPAPPSPDTKDPETGKKFGGGVRGGPAGALLRAHRKSQHSPPVPSEPQPATARVEPPEAPTAAPDPAEEAAAWVRDQVKDIQTADPDDVDRWQPVGVTRNVDGDDGSLQAMSARMSRECGPFASITDPYATQRRPDGSMS